MYGSCPAAGKPAVGPVQSCGPLVLGTSGLRTTAPDARKAPGRWSAAALAAGCGPAAQPPLLLDLLLDDGEHVTGGEHQVLLAVVLHLGAAVLAVQHHVTDLDVHRHALGAGVVEPAGAHSQDFALLGLLLGGVWNDEPGRSGLLGLQSANHDPVFEWLENNLGSGRHDLTSSSEKDGETTIKRGTTMASCRRGCQTSLVALALYPRECQSRTVVRAGRAVKRPAGKPQARTLVTGSAESAPTSSGDGLASRATSSAPSAATMAPLSVHRPGRGTRSRMPAASQRSAASARSRELAATPPPMTRWSTPFAWQACTALRVSTSATASWKDAATSATGTLTPAARRSSTQRATAVFSPENEKSKVWSRYLARGKAIAAGSPPRASLSIGGPPGNGSPSTRATLSYASPAA